MVITKLFFYLFVNLYGRAVVQHHLSIPSRSFLLSVHSCEGEEHFRDFADNMNNTILNIDALFTKVLEADDNTMVRNDYQIKVLSYLNGTPRDLKEYHGVIMVTCLTMSLLRFDIVADKLSHCVYYLLLVQFAVRHLV